MVGHDMVGELRDINRQPYLTLESDTTIILLISVTVDRQSERLN